MSRVLEAPQQGLLADGSKPAGWWHAIEGGERIECDLCPRACRLKPGDRGFCFVRENRDGQMVLSTYGRSTGFCIDPIEKKPLNHFLPGTPVLSFGTAGCNLGCKFCQNWGISKSREVERLSALALPEQIATAAQVSGCRSVAFTYNDPVIWAEYAIDTARACQAVGIKTVAVSAGYITPEARSSFFEFMDAANVDLKAFSEDFYHKITLSHLEPVLDTLVWLKHESDVWFEITNLIIPQANDSQDELARLCDFVAERLGPDVPLHFSAFHPDYRMRDREATPRETLERAHELARSRGLRFVYTGNVHDVSRQSTSCPTCKSLVIERDWYQLGRYALREDACGACGQKIPGVFESEPGHWGRKRQPIDIRDPTFLRSTSPKLLQLAVPMPTALPSTTRPSRPTVLDSQQQQTLLEGVCQLISATVNRSKVQVSLGDLEDRPVAGAFVTLKRAGHLRSCRGLLLTDRQLSLGQAVRHAAITTASDDPRFPRLVAREVPQLEIEVTILDDCQPIPGRGADRADAIEVGRHGLQIRLGESHGLLLPGVATSHGWTSEEFLNGLCHKAGLPPLAWQRDSAELTRFRGESARGPFSAPPPAPRKNLLQAGDVPGLVRLATEQLATLLAGGSPMVYGFDCPDGNVTGLILHFEIDAHEGPPIDFAEISLRPGVPLQATLGKLCQTAAKTLIRTVPVEQLETARIGLTVLSSPALQGGLAEPDTQGFDPKQHGWIVLRGGEMLAVFDPSESADQSLSRIQTLAGHRSRSRTPIYSAVVHSSRAAVEYRSKPAAVIGTRVRPPARSGQFYPTDPVELAQIVNLCLDQHTERKHAAAILVPHAALAYSGKIAGRVFQRVRIPKTVIVLGPKHTSEGVEWAIAPQEHWQIPGHQIPNDPRLAQRLVQAISGLELDAQAHRMEHGIEVELPFLARLAPASRVLGIAIGQAEWSDCQHIAAGLASVIWTLPEPPLLVISSDMNHYSPDDETRQLDATALAAFETLDGEKLLQTVRSHHISMCGVIPAAIVLETLRRLGGRHRVERVGYATSGDMSGERQRVVGYAGLVIE
jgi:AmmeMemoRadiSam system radical SAM enzyme/AmmeMemoRadiSam system protein B/AmmeMemoRadiSam system protein A